MIVSSNLSSKVNELIICITHFHFGLVLVLIFTMYEENVIDDILHLYKHNILIFHSLNMVCFYDNLLCDFTKAEENMKIEKKFL